MHIQLYKIGVEPQEEAMFPSEEGPWAFFPREWDSRDLRQQEGNFLGFTADRNSYIIASLWEKKEVFVGCLSKSKGKRRSQWFAHLVGADSPKPSESALVSMECQNQESTAPSTQFLGWIYAFK